MFVLIGSDFLPFGSIQSSGVGHQLMADASLVQVHSRPARYSHAQSSEASVGVEDLLERLEASNATALPTAPATGSFISNEVTLEMDSLFDSITKSLCTQKSFSVAVELDKVIKEKYAPMKPIKFETLSSKIGKEMCL
ncbi:hypothetical protein TNCV_2193531 [Trichonephila clavipes]|nr:hypothetical protein TNCV_2193531 [Trichonephila clavipes]